MRGRVEQVGAAAEGQTALARSADAGALAEASSKASPSLAPRGPLEGLLVIALEQAVAAPYCSSRLADAGARVIKIERPEGDFARGYDRTVHGEASYWVWINRGKESIALDLKQKGELEVLYRMLGRADVFLQNLAPGASERMGIGSQSLRERFPRLITCDISGYGDAGARMGLKAYDLLVQAESGLVAVSGAPGPWGRIGVSICDIAAGMNALIGIQQALLQRHRTGVGSAVKVSLFGSAAELMSVPYLQTRYGGKAPQRLGLKHPSIAPYGAFRSAEGRDLVLSIQNEREWADFCRIVLQRPDLPQDPRCCNNAARVEHRDFVDGLVAEVFASLKALELEQRLDAAQTAYGKVNTVEDLIAHPQLRTVAMQVQANQVEIPALPWDVDWNPPAFPPAPALDADGERLRKEFAPS